jgi:hypothetical protein
MNVLTMIDAADRLFDKMAGKKMGVLRDNYEWLSETCHPNSYGVIMTTTQKQDRVFEFKLSRERIRINYQNIGYLDISMPLFFNFYDRALLRIQEKERLPDVEAGFGAISTIMRTRF